MKQKVSLIQVHNAIVYEGKQGIIVVVQIHQIISTK